MLRKVIYLLAACTVAASLYLALSFERGAGSFAGRDITCVIDLEEFDLKRDGLVTGYNYTLLKRFADDIGASTSIHSGSPDVSWADSLASGIVDIVVLPMGEISPNDSIALSIPVDSLTVWAVSTASVKGLQEIDSWLDSYHASEECATLHDLYMETHDPMRMKSSDHLSPYDDIIRAGADSLGWDWRLLAALIYQESKFRINAESGRGARGLMQMMPRTAEHYEVENILDPHESIAAGVEFMIRLQKIFKPLSRNPKENRKIAIAAYNAGEGRIGGYVRKAQEQMGRKKVSWDEVEQQMDSLDNFNSTETLDYIRKIGLYYSAFKKICPREPIESAPTGQDPL